MSQKKILLLAMAALIIAMLTSCGNDSMINVPLEMTVCSVNMVQMVNRVPKKSGGYDEETVYYYLCRVKESDNLQLVTKTHVSCGDKVNLFLTLRNGFGAEVLE